MSNKHPHEEVILAYYRGEEIQLLWDGSWIDVHPYDIGEPFPTTLTFSPESKYRIKPKTHNLSLTQSEVEILWCILRMFGGDPRCTAREHVESVYENLDQLPDNSRKQAIVEWGRTAIDWTNLNIHAPLP